MSVGIHFSRPKLLLLPSDHSEWFFIYGYFREKSGLSDVLNSKQEETEAYLSEIEVSILPNFFRWMTPYLNFWNWPKIVGIIFQQTIGQAYDDMQTQNQKLLQEISERDDYNMKVSNKPGFN